MCAAGLTAAAARLALMQLPRYCRCLEPAFAAREACSSVLPVGQTSCLRTVLALLDALLQADKAAPPSAAAVELAFQFALAQGLGATVSPADRAR